MRINRCLKPTRLQCVVPHHPEVDVWPWAAWRDKIIGMEKGLDDWVFCWDVLYGVGVESGRTGLIVWGDPWLSESWEVDEGFARKYSWLLRGCDALLKSTNRWRARRGEKRLVLDS
jgi:hypothetical protein